MSELVVMPKSDWTGILDSVRGKTGKTDLMTSGVVASEIAGIKAGGSESVSPKEVNFYDYDGTILHAYSVEEAQSLTELPELPSHDGLICQGWNFDLATIKSINRALNIGAMYITDDGKTRLYIKIATEGRMSVPLYISQTVANGVTIDWGDGSATETLAGTGNVNTIHTYASIGDYVISLAVAEGCTLGFGDGTGSNGILGSNGNNGLVYLTMLQKVEIGSGVSTIDTNAFMNCYTLTYITIPNGIITIGTRAFMYCYGLAFITIPNSVTSLVAMSFHGCYSLVSVSIPNSLTTCGMESFNFCYSLKSITLPNDAIFKGTNPLSNCPSLSYIFIPKNVSVNGVVNNCYGLAVMDLTSYTSIPSLKSNGLYNLPTDCQIKVPASLYDSWITATNWANYAEQIVAV